MNTLPLQLAGLGIPTLIVALIFILGAYLPNANDITHSLPNTAHSFKKKEAALGFVQNVGSVFADAETVEMTHLLERVLHYAVRTCKAGSGAIYLRDNQKKLFLHEPFPVSCPLCLKWNPIHSKLDPTPPSNFITYSPKKNSLSVKPSLVKSPSKETPNTSTMPKWMFAFHKRISNFYASEPFCSFPCDLETMLSAL